jgi:hypothetical protein
MLTFQNISDKEKDLFILSNISKGAWNFHPYTDECFTETYI